MATITKEMREELTEIIDDYTSVIGNECYHCWGQRCDDCEFGTAEVIAKIEAVVLSKI